LRSHSTTIKPGYKPGLRFGSMRQLARLMIEKVKFSIKNTNNFGFFKYKRFNMVLRFKTKFEVV